MTAQQNNYSAPNRKAMLAAKATLINKQETLKFVFLPLIKEKLLSLSRTAGVSDFGTFDALRNISVTLLDTGIDAIDKKIDQVNAASLSEKQKQSALMMLASDKTRRVIEVMNVLKANATKIDKLQNDVASISLELLDKELESSIQSTVDRLSGELQKLDTQISETGKSRRALDEAIGILDKVSTFDQIIDTLPSAGEIASLGLSPSQAAVLKLGLDHLRKVLGKVSEALKYFELVDARDELRRRQDLLVSQRREQAEEKQEYLKQIGEIGDLQLIITAQAFWIAQSQKISDALETFIHAHPLVGDSEGLAWSEDFLMLRQYIDSFAGVIRV